MKAYRDILIEYVQGRGLDSHYQADKERLFVLPGAGNKDILWLFSFEHCTVMSWSLLLWQVPQSNKGRVERLLNTLNRELGKGMFYIDKEKKCVAFSRFYLGSGFADCDKPWLEDFCREVLDVMPRYDRRIREEALRQEDKDT